MPSNLIRRGGLAAMLGGIVGILYAPCVLKNCLQQQYLRQLCSVERRSRRMNPSQARYPENNPRN